MASPAEVPAEPLDRSRSAVRPLLVAVGLADAALAGWLSYGRAYDAGTTDITVLWIVALALVVLGAGAGPPVLARARSAARRLRPADGATRAPWSTEARLGAIVLVAAAAVRLVALDRFPTVLDSDEGFLILVGRQARTGDLPNPYGASFYNNPDLYRAVAGVLTRPFADTVAAYRLLSALVGTASVAATWRLGRRLLGERVGLASAAVLAVLPLHVWGSRSGLNNISDAGGLAVALVFLDRAVAHRRARDALVAGLVAGFGFSGYFGSAAVPVAIGAWLLVVGVRRRDRVPVAAVARLAGWVLAGIGTAAAPLLGWWAAHPDIALGRFRQVSTTGGDAGIGSHVADLRTTLLRPFLDAPVGFHRSPAPSVGWAVAPFVAVGLVVWAARLLRRRRDERGVHRPGLVVVAWLAVAAGVSGTSQQASQRTLGLSVLWALAAGTGVVAVAQGVGAIVRRPTWLPAVLTAVTVAVAGVVGGAGYFTERQQLRNYTDVTTIAAYDLGWRLARTEGPPAVLVVGGDAFSYGGYGNLQFLAPDAAETTTAVADLPAELGGPPAAPPLPDVAAGSVIVLPARHDVGRCPLIASYPGSTVDEVRDRRGTLLYLALHVAAPGPGLSVRSTPADTALAVIVPDCPTG